MQVEPAPGSAERCYTETEADEPPTSFSLPWKPVFGAVNPRVHTAAAFDTGHGFKVPTRSAMGLAPLHPPHPGLHSSGSRELSQLSRQVTQP